MSGRHVGRRAVAGSGLAVLVLAAAAAEQGKAEELDGELLAVAAEHLRLQEESLADFRTSDDKAFMQRDMPRVYRMNELQALVEGLRPTTPAGFAAKARLAASLTREHHELNGEIPEEGPRMAYSLCMDLGDSG